MTPTAPVVYIGIGSNLDDPVQQVTRAIAELRLLPDSELTAASRLYRSAPLGPPGQPDYINAVAALRTGLRPWDLLDELQRIEREHRRVRTQKWGPRTLDLDILLYGDRFIVDRRLIVPHPQLANRPFVLYPLADVAPQLILPDGVDLQTLLAQCDATGLTQFA